MPIIRPCKVCGRKNRIPANHLADTGRCGQCKTALPPIDEPLEVDVEQFDEITQNSRVPVLADFWAEWCGPCKMAAPEVEKTAKDMAGKAVVIKVDTETLSSAFGALHHPWHSLLRRLRFRKTSGAASRPGEPQPDGDLA